MKDRSYLSLKIKANSEIRLRDGRTIFKNRHPYAISLAIEILNEPQQSEAEKISNEKLEIKAI